MSGHQYLEEILAKYNLGENEVEPMKKKRKIIEDLMKKHFGSKIDTFYYSGSYAKGTAINLKYDLDLCVYFQQDAFSSLKDMYNQTYNLLKSENPRKQVVSIGINLGKEQIDIVPARRISPDSYDANLYVTTTGSQIKTNIPTHKNFISESKARPIIKLMKVWKYRHSIHYKSFALELLTIRALNNFNGSEYDKKFLHVLKFISDNVIDIRLVDPANSNNVVSQLITDNDKINIKRQAEASLKKKYWKDIVW